MISHLYNRQLQIQLYLFLLVGSAITITTLIPGEYVPPTPGSDKTNHLLAFFIWAGATTFFRTRRTLFLWIVIAIWGGAIEIIQPYFGRWSEMMDFVADIIGAIAGGATGHLLGIFFFKQYTQRCDNRTE